MALVCMGMFIGNYICKCVVECVYSPKNGRGFCENGPKYYMTISCSSLCELIS